MRNQEIPEIFYKIADILEIQGVEWKPRAYRAAASAIESMPEPVESVYKEGGLKALDEIPGVGEALAKKLEELVKTGKLAYYKKLCKTVPIDLALLDAVPGLGPKKLRALHKELAISTLEGLKKAAEKHQVVSIAGFAEKTEQEILKALEKNGVKAGRIPLAKALPIASKFVKALKKVKCVLEVEVAGSLRRQRPTIGDIDILVSSKEQGRVAKAILAMPGIKKVLASGQTKTSIVLENGMQVDFRVVKPKQWGSALQYFTGSKAHSIALRKIAIKKGLKLSEYGVFKDGKVIASKTEKEVYNALGLDFVEPEQRENKGEIEAALKSFAKRSK